MAGSASSSAASQNLPIMARSQPTIARLQTSRRGRIGRYPSQFISPERKDRTMKKLMIAAATAALAVSLPAAASAASLGLKAGASASVDGSGASVGADVGADTCT